MILLFFLISLIFMICGIILYNKTMMFEKLGLAIGIFNGIICFITLLIAMFAFGDLVNGRTIDARLEMYQEENAAIETSINELVDNYYVHEAEIYNSLTPENASFFAIAYPELNSNAFAQQQINLYIENNQKIKELKLEKIELTNVRWRLYFGS